MGTFQVELDDHTGIGVMEGDHLIALVGEGGPRIVEVAAHGLLPIEDIARGHDLVTGVTERAQRGLEVVLVLRLHVFADERLAPLAQFLADGYFEVWDAEYLYGDECRAAAGRIRGLESR